jgi:hypothetical protein
MCVGSISNTDTCNEIVAGVCFGSSSLCAVVSSDDEERDFHEALLAYTHPRTESTLFNYSLSIKKFLFTFKA